HSSLPLTLTLFLFHHTAHIYPSTLSLHDALPISTPSAKRSVRRSLGRLRACSGDMYAGVPTIAPSVSVPVPSCSFDTPKSRIFQDRKSTRLNSSHGSISYAVFCLKKKK